MHIYFSLFSSNLINLYIVIIHNACSASQFLHTQKRSAPCYIYVLSGRENYFKTVCVLYIL